ncbi:hypothetical protein D3C86_2132960 [compost metagenome]
MEVLISELGATARGLVVGAGGDVETRDRAIGLDTEEGEHLHGNIRSHQAGPGPYSMGGAAGVGGILSRLEGYR